MTIINDIREEKDEEKKMIQLFRSEVKTEARDEKEKKKDDDRPK